MTLLSPEGRSPDEAEKKALWARCPKCAHAWAVAYYPMSMGTMAKVMKANCKHCPRCGSGGALIAKQDNGVLLPEDSP